MDLCTEGRIEGCWIIWWLLIYLFSARRTQRWPFVCFSCCMWKHHHVFILFCASVKSTNTLVWLQAASHTLYVWTCCYWLCLNFFFYSVCSGNVSKPRVDICCFMCCFFPLIVQCMRTHSFPVATLADSPTLIIFCRLLFLWKLCASCIHYMLLLFCLGALSRTICIFSLKSKRTHTCICLWPLDIEGRLCTWRHYTGNTPCNCSSNLGILLFLAAVQRNPFQIF